MNREEIDYWLRYFSNHNHGFMSEDGKKITLFKMFQELKELQYLLKIKNDYIKELQQENQELKEQVEDKENIACNWKDSCLENAGKVEKLENQQKEFINYLENEKDRLARVCNNICEDKFDEVNDILQEYKAIIGGNYDNNTTL